MLGSKHVSDEALLKANDTIRKMFAYRHDILKAMIADGARLVVLGRKEKLSDLPEFKDARDQAGFDEVRYLDYTPDLKLMVVPEENVLGLPEEPFAGKCMVIHVFARAAPGDRPAPGRSRLREAAAQAAVRAAGEAAGRRVRPEREELSRRPGQGPVEGHAGRPRPRRVLGGRRGGLLRRRRRRPAAPPRRTAPSPPARPSRRTTPTLMLVDETMAYREHVDCSQRPTSRE